jgi:hypothetical protein
MAKKSFAALTVLAAVSAIALLSGCRSPAAAPAAQQPAAAPTAQQSAAAPAAQQSAAQTLTLGPLGLGAVQLSQSLEDALATGLLYPVPAASGGERCGLRAKFKDAPENTGTGVAANVFAGDLGVSAIDTYGDIGTPEGIRIGSRYDDLIKAYPSWRSGESDPTDHNGHGLVPVPGNAQAYYRISVNDGRVLSITLQLKNQDCYE